MMLLQNSLSFVLKLGNLVSHPKDRYLPGSLWLGQPAALARASPDELRDECAAQEALCMPSWVFYHHCSFPVMRISALQRAAEMYLETCLARFCSWGSWHGDTELFALRAIINLLFVPLSRALQVFLQYECYLYSAIKLRLNVNCCQH